MQWCAACIYKAPLTSSYRGLSYSDPFGLCIWDGCIAEFLVASAVVSVATRYIWNKATGRPATENLARDARNGLLIAGALASGGSLGGASLVGGARAVATEATATGSAAAATKLAIQFGKNANQVEHAFRHMDEIGLNRADVQSAVEAHLQSAASLLQPGKPLNQIIEVAGQRIQYTAYLLKDGVINVGRIHPVR